jgi:hypothetical protein
MKKVIPQKIVNIVYGKLLAGKRLEGNKGHTKIGKNIWTDNWREDLFYKPSNSEVSNRFFKNKVTRFTYKCDCDRCINGKLASTRKRIEKLKEDLNDYLQEQS